MAGVHGFQELEIKLFLADLPAFQEKLERSGAQQVQEPILELNLRFDTPAEELARSHRVLRLRKDAENRLTYKGPGKVVEGVRVRQEIEFSVADFEACKALLEALGYHVSMVYEKRRSVYSLNQTLISLDQLPYGDFTEIEGPDAAHIRAAAEKLGLDWEARINESYTALFERLKNVLMFSFQHLTFENFAGLRVTPVDLGVRPADRTSEN